MERKTVLMKTAAVLILVLLAVSHLVCEEENVVQGVLKLLNAKANEEVVLAYIQYKGAPEHITADEIVSLVNAGASVNIIKAVLGKQAAAVSGFPFDLDDKHQVLAPLIHGAIAVYPVKRKVPVTSESYLTLDEAVTQKVVAIKEQGDSGSVPVVIITNAGSLPIYISAGEVIIGGKQDRMISYDVVIKPGKTLSVNVRCVEQGRWSAQKGNKTFTSGSSIGCYGTRGSVQYKGQSDVWKEVARQNSKLGAQTGTGTYNAALQKEEVKKMHNEASAVILPKLTGRNTVGSIFALNGEILAIDIFGNPALFSKMKEKLIKAYVLDAIGVKDEKGKIADKKTIMDFYTSAMKAKAQELKKYSSNSNVMRASEEAQANDSVDEKGELLHRSLLKRQK